MQKTINETEVLVFCYGTLKKGGRFHYAMQEAKAEYLCDVSEMSRSFKMKSLTHYPALVKAPNNSGTYITGELYSIPTATLHIIDQIEGYPTFYNRESITVFNEDGNPYLALAYYIPTGNIPQVDTAPDVESGTWSVTTIEASYASDPYVASHEYLNYDDADEDCPRCGWWVTTDGCPNCASYDQRQEVDLIHELCETDTGYKTTDFTVDTGVFVSDMDGNQFGPFTDIADACNNLGNVANMTGVTVDMLTVGFRVIHNDIEPSAYKSINDHTTNIKGN